MIVLTDLVFTTDQKFFPFPTSFMVIHNGSACGFTNHEKYHTEYMEKFLENNLQADGSVRIPEVLRPYMGGMTELK